MAKENLLGKVEGAKVWGYVAMAGGLVAVAGVVFAVKEMMDARRVAEVKEDVKETMKEVAAENGVEIAEESTTEETSGCGGCSGTSGFNAAKSLDKNLLTGKTSYETESFSGARFTDIWGGGRTEMNRKKCIYEGGSWNPQSRTCHKMNKPTA